MENKKPLEENKNLVEEFLNKIRKIGLIEEEINLLLDGQTIKFNKNIEEVNDIDMNIFANYSYNMTPISPNTKIPSNINEVLFFHGIKSQEHYDRIKNTYNKKVLA